MLYKTIGTKFVYYKQACPSFGMDSTGKDFPTIKDH